MASRTQSRWVPTSFLCHLRRHGCHLKREGVSHSLWTNPQTGEVEAVPRHPEIPNRLAPPIRSAAGFQFLNSVNE
ncbi:MAG TPA: type II toxin-antitoxin system HicA family toxin [Acidobacteriota bacterium]|nr:type II toxin-antitoxin system HicA family toxin [Acidobacteriota bacterium]